MADEQLGYDEISVPSEDPPPSEGVGNRRSNAYEEEAFSADPNDPQVFGKTFIDSLFKILKIGSIYEVQHNQTRIAAEEFMEFFNEAMRLSSDEEVSIVIRDELAVVNGEAIRIRRKTQERLNDLRDLFASATIKGLLLGQSMTADDLLHFLGELRVASKERSDMEHVQIPTIQIDHGKPTRQIIEAIMNVDKAMYVAHVYVRGLVKVRNMHETVREKNDSDVPTGVLRRIMQSVSELLADEDFTILGLLTMRMVPPDISSHSFNSAIYTMLMGDRLGLSPQITSFLGMTTLYQDLERLVGINVGHRERDADENPSRQYTMNLRDVAKMLPRVEGDVISTLRVLTTYERNCPFDSKIGEPFYRRPRLLHLANRIIDICRAYDLLIQGLQGYKARRPDLAIEYVQNRAGDHFDPTLVELMVSTLGIYPIGTTVQLSSGEKAVVIKTPEPSKDARRPVVRILNTENPQVIDLGEPRFSNIEIAGSVDVDPGEITVSKIFLLS